MTWFKVDDTAHMHPKLIKAGNAALGLWLRGGAYAAQHLTEGTVPGVVAQLYGTAPQARKLVTAGLWHEHGHTCARCPQPPAGDYVMHDFLTYNPTRAKVETERQKAAERQARGREKQAAQRGKPAESSPKTNRFEDESSTEKHESSPNRIASQDTFAGQEDMSHRDGADPSRWSRPDPTRLVLPTEEQASYAGERDPIIPAALLPLREALTTAGVVVEWDLPTADWFRLEAIAKRTATTALVQHAVGMTQRARTRPQSVRYFLPGWQALPPVAEGAAVGANVVPIGFAGSARPSTTDQRVADGMTLAARLRAQEAAQ